MSESACPECYGPYARSEPSCLTCGYVSLPPLASLIRAASSPATGLASAEPPPPFRTRFTQVRWKPAGLQWFAGLFADLVVAAFRPKPGSFIRPWKPTDYGELWGYVGGVVDPTDSALLYEVIRPIAGKEPPWSRPNEPIELRNVLTMIDLAHMTGTDCDDLYHALDAAMHYHEQRPARRS